MPYERYSWSIGKKTTGALGPVRYRGFFNSESKIQTTWTRQVSQSSGWRDGQNYLEMNDRFHRWSLTSLRVRSEIRREEPAART